VSTRSGVWLFVPALLAAIAAVVLRAVRRAPVPRAPIASAGLRGGFGCPRHDAGEPSRG
jgi:hypothetical protein